MDTDMYRVCRWCKHFDRELQACINDQAFIMDDDFEFYPFYENGHLSEAIKEGLESSNIQAAFNRIEQYLANTGLSGKKQREFLSSMYEELETMKILWTEQIDESVSLALERFDFDFGGVFIAEPSDFYCKHYF